MLILGLDSTAVSASAAVAEMDETGLHARCFFSVKNKLTHSENLLPMADHVLRIFGAELPDVGLFAVNAGPGSFTGVRIGVSTVKGLAFSGGAPCAAVSTLASIAENLRGTGGTVCALMDARRDQFYYALFRDGERLTEDAVASAEDILSRLKGDVWLCGDGAEPFARKAETGNADVRFRLAPVLCREQNALSTAICGYRMFLEGRTVSARELRPVYLRVPQAERERMRKEAEAANQEE